MLNHFLAGNKVDPNNQDWLSAITNSLQLLEKLISVPESEAGIEWKYRGSMNKDYALEIIPIVSLLEFAITSDSMQLNYLAIKVIGLYNDGTSTDKEVSYNEMFPDGVLFIMN